MPPFLKLSNNHYVTLHLTEYPLCWGICPEIILVAFAVTTRHPRYGHCLTLCARAEGIEFGARFSQLCVDLGYCALLNHLVRKGTRRVLVFAAIF